MNLSDLKAAGSFADMSGVKALIYGPPGSGKTPVFNTVSKGILLACEPGMLSMKGSQMPTYQAHTGPLIEEFFKWWFSSQETKNFDTLGIDSVSQLADIFLQEALKKHKHGLQAYGEMGEKTMEVLRPLFFQKQKHCYLICKQTVEKENGFDVRKPYFPGRQLPTEIPHLYDMILHLDIHAVPATATRPAMGQIQSFQTRRSIDISARDRSGKLDEFEPPNFGYVIEKAMQG